LVPRLLVDGGQTVDDCLSVGGLELLAAQMLEAVDEGLEGVVVEVALGDLVDSVAVDQPDD
jgi:urease gamma subunit